MARKITNKKEMKTLWKQGVISKTTYYRGIKRGYVVLDYHKPHKKYNDFNSKDFWEEVLKERNNLLAIVNNNIFDSKKDYYSLEELFNEGVLYLFERQIMPSKGYAHIKSYIRSIMRGKARKCLNYSQKYYEDSITEYYEIIK